jgi:hypothetical protein
MRSTLDQRERTRQGARLIRRGEGEEGNLEKPPRYIYKKRGENGQILRVIFSLRRTESPMKRPQFKHPTHGSKVKSDKKLRREQRRRDKHAKKADKPPP